MSGLKKSWLGSSCSRRGDTQCDKKWLSLDNQKRVGYTLETSRGAALTKIHGGPLEIKSVTRVTASV